MNQGSGGTTSAEATSQTERLIRAAHYILGILDVGMSPSRVTRLVRRYETRAQRGTRGFLEVAGWSFIEFFGTHCWLTAEQRHRVLADPASGPNSTVRQDH
jgi:hypothetical protein